MSKLDTLSITSRPPGLLSFGRADLITGAIVFAATWALAIFASRAVLPALWLIGLPLGIAAVINIRLLGFIAFFAGALLAGNMFFSYGAIGFVPLLFIRPKNLSEKFAQLLKSLSVPTAISYVITYILTEMMFPGLVRMQDIFLAIFGIFLAAVFSRFISAIWSAVNDRGKAEPVIQPVAVEEVKVDPEVERQKKLVLEKHWRAFFENRMNVLSVNSGDVNYKENIDYGANQWLTCDFSINFNLKRSLSSMPSREIEILKYLYIFHVHELFSGKDLSHVLWGLAYNDGNSEQEIIDIKCPSAYADKYSIRSTSDGVKHVIDKWNSGSKEAAISSFFARFSSIERNNQHPIVLEFKSKILGGTNWADDSLISSVFGDEGPTALFIGTSETGQKVWYNHDGSLVSIAPPGSGKTQCNVLPNLLSYHGPAVVLDVKGECYEKTAAWRKANVGPVFKFNPLNPADSARYNPLAFLPDDPDALWEDCRLLADLLIVPENKQDPSWENRARDVVTGILAWLALNNPADKRSLGQLVDVVGKIGWNDFISGAKYAMEVPPLRRLGNSLADMPEKQLEGILDAARRHLAVWEGARVEKVTSVCDWTPESLRNGSNATVYICIPPTEIESYAALLRVLFAQHLRQLMRELPPPGQTPILFMMDELPRLGPMKPVEEALEVGRQYGIRLWMFAQSLGQFEKAYANADGMVGSCAMRIFMNPSQHDGTAKRLSEELGYAESIIDGSRRLMVEPTDLAGPDYKDVQIVFARNARPAKLKKVFAYAEPEFRERMNAAGDGR